MSQYKVSVVMAVYNVERYLREAVDSVIQQDIGFENIQLILVDDGSKDKSGTICEEYANNFPQNILAIHKENGGVSSARNEGLKYVQGEFVNFLDSDDKLSPNTAREVCDFFAQHYDEMDVVAFPVVLFDGGRGEHILNYKFKNGSRVIDLTTEWDNPQLSISSTFVKSTALKSRQFDTQLKYAEDAQILQSILIDKCRLGVVCSATYWYRRHSSGEKSAIQSSITQRSWYLPYMLHFHLETIRLCEEKMHKVPLFVQYTLMYDMQWRFRLAKIPDAVLSQEELEAYFTAIFRMLQSIGDDVIFAQRNISVEYKLLALRLKYPEGAYQLAKGEDLCLSCNGQIRYKTSDAVVALEFATIEKDYCILEGYWHDVLSIDGTVFFAKVGNAVYEVEHLGDRKPLVALGHTIRNNRAFRVRIPLDKGSVHSISFGVRTDGISSTLRTFAFEKFFPVSDYLNGYYVKNGWILTISDGQLRFSPYSRWLHLRLEAAIWKALGPDDRNIILFRIAVSLLKRCKRKPIWVIADRSMSADDNGEAMFRYVRSEHPEIKAFFVISESSMRYADLKQLGPVLKNGSYMHKLFVLLSDCVLTSSASLEIVNPFYEHFELYRDLMAGVKYVFLQHGITKDDISAWAGKTNQNFAGFVTAAKPEWDSIVNGTYGYTREQVWLTGLPRFDRLYHDEQKWLTIMPTWRRYLFTRRDLSTDAWTLEPGVENSEYVRFVNALLNDPRLHRAAEKYGYQIAFFPHTNFQPHLWLFSGNQNVHLLGRETHYRDVFAKSNLIVTDYSSVVFDFVYLRKPIVYAQIDAEEFFSGKHMYSTGYFDYERDGFGEVEYTLENTVDRIIEYMENGCVLKDKYRQRIDSFFAFDDHNNRERVCQKIIGLTGK